MAYIINGETISDEVIEDEFESIKEHYLNAGEVVCCDRDEEFWTYARENVVNRVLLEQASIKKYGEPKDADVEAKFQQIIGEHGGEDAFYENTGFNRGDEFVLRRKVKSGMMVDRYLEDESEAAEPTPENLKAYYEENIDKFQTGVEVECSQLFFEPKSHEGAKDAFDNLCKVRFEMLDGGDFEKLAAEHSGVDEEEVRMGYVEQGKTLPQIEAQMFSMKPGEISPIITTEFGFHIVKITDRKEPAPVPMEEIEDLEESFLIQRRQDSIDKIIDRLKEEGSVEEVSEEEQPA